MPSGGVEGTPGGVLTEHPQGVLSTVKRGVDRTPNPKRSVIREEKRERARARATSRMAGSGIVEALHGQSPQLP